MRINWSHLGDGIGAIADAKMSDDAAKILARQQQTTMQDTSSQASDPNYTYDSDTGQYVPSLKSIQDGTDQGLQAATPTFKSQSTFNGQTRDTPFTPDEVRSQNIKDATDFWQSKGAFGTDMVKNLQGSQLNDAKLAESKQGLAKGKLELEKLGYDIGDLQTKKQIGDDYRKHIDNANAILNNADYANDLVGQARALSQAYKMLPNGGEAGVTADGKYMWHVDKNGTPLKAEINADTIAKAHAGYLDEARSLYRTQMEALDPNLMYHNDSVRQKDREIGIQQQTANTQENYRKDQGRHLDAQDRLVDAQIATGNWGANAYHRAAGASLSEKAGVNAAIGITDEGSMIVPDGKGGYTTKPIMIDGKPATPAQVKVFKSVHAADNSLGPLSPKDQATIMKDIYTSFPDFAKMPAADQAKIKEDFGIKGAASSGPFKVLGARGAPGAQGGDQAPPVKSSSGLQSSLRTMFAPSGATSAAYSMGDQYVRDPVSGQMITAAEYTRKFGEVPTN
jgi:hypothetical protein